MFPAIAPNHVRNWDSLVSIRFFDSTAFHRVIPGFMIQGGDPNSRSGPRDTWGYGGSETLLDAEFNSVSHRRGILSAARTNDPNSASSQFFICVANPTYLDRQYTVYGKVTSGMEVADSIVSAETDGSDNPLEKISMFITRTGSNDSLTSAPQLVSPKNDSVLATLTQVPLRWRKVPDAMLYRVQVALDKWFSNIILDSSLRQIDTSLTVKKLTAEVTYYWRVMANNGGNPSEYSSVWRFGNGSLAVRDASAPILELLDIYPNPSSGSATIGFRLTEPSVVRLEVVDMLGRSVFKLIDLRLISAGVHDALIAQGMLPPGIYAYRLEAGGTSISKKFVLQ